MYPRSILKKRGYVDALSLSQITEKINLVSVRRSTKPIEFIEFHGVKTISVKPVKDNEIVDMSMNLAGGKWMIKHIHYADKSKEEHTNKLPNFFYTVLHPKSVAHYKEAYPLLISVNAINETKFEYPILFKDKNQRNAFLQHYPVDDKKHLSNSANAQDVYVVKCEVSHKPTFLNFWHCVLNLKLDDTLLQKKPNSYKIVTAAFWDSLMKPAILESLEKTDYIIPCSFYYDKNLG